jgi:hypothetical protein
MMHGHGNMHPPPMWNEGYGHPHDPRSHMAHPPMCRLCNQVGHLEHQCQGGRGRGPVLPPQESNYTRGAKTAPSQATAQSSAAAPPNAPPASSSTSGSAPPPPPTPAVIYNCEPCGKEFKVKAQYDAHCGTHVQCEYPDCTFTASNKVVKSHAITMHRPPVVLPKELDEIIPEKYKFVTKIGYTDEDIAKWKEDRRKSWPSAANIQNKVDEANRRSMAGELDPEEKKGNKLNKKRQGMDDNKGRAPAKKARFDVVEGESNLSASEVAECKLMKAEDTAVKEEEPRGKLPCRFFSRNGKCKNGDACTYAHVVVMKEKPIKVCKNFKAGSCNNGDACKFSHDKSLRREALAAERSKNVKKEKSSTLLKKLLEKTQRKETSLLLQCIRHFVQEDFFLKKA